jgi:prepilin-type processing-associated H-X9-DG protein
MAKEDKKTEGQKHIRGKMQTDMKAVYIVCGVIVVTCIVILSIFVPFLVVGKDLHDRDMCEGRLKSIWRALRVYNSDNGQYPPLEKWYDVLADVNEFNVFQIWDSREVSCWWAMNPSAEADSHPDVVLVFDSSDGWNRTGGPELLSTDGHKGRGCNVLFNDGHVRFVKPEEVDQLRWE